MSPLSFGGVLYDTCKGVYAPAEDTFLMLDSISNESIGDTALDMGTGTGIIAIYLSKGGASVTASDISRPALQCAESNFILNSQSIQTKLSDLFSSIPEKYDTITFNPPYLPTQDAVEGSEAWDGGPDGFSVTRRFLKQLKDHLTNHGRAYLILSDATRVGDLFEEFPELEFTKIGENVFEFETIWAFCVKVREKFAYN